MENNMNLLMRCAMQYGVYLGLFFILMFASMVGAIYEPMFNTLAVLLMLAVPFLLYNFMKRYQNQMAGVRISFIQFWVFGIFLFLFASLLSGIVHYIYYQYINPNFTQMQVASLVQQLDTLESLKNSPLAAQLKSMLDEIKTPTSIEMVIQSIWSNVFWGSLLSIVIGLMMSLSKKNRQSI